MIDKSSRRKVSFVFDENSNRIRNTLEIEILSNDDFDKKIDYWNRKPMAARHCLTEIIVHNRIRVDQKRYKHTPQQLSNTRSK